MHRYFFYNFLISAGFQDLLILATTMSDLNPGFTLNDFREQLFNTLAMICHQLSCSKKLNDQVDAAIIGEVIVEKTIIGNREQMKVRDL